MQTLMQRVVTHEMFGIVWWFHFMPITKQEVISQVLFWSGIGCLPSSIAFFVAAFCAKYRWKVVLALFVLGSVSVTHFLCVNDNMGRAFCTGAGMEFHPTPWWHFYPIGFSVAILLAGIRYIVRHQKMNRTTDRESTTQSKPPLLPPR